MAIPILILGESGSGKTTSLRNFNPEGVALIQTINKRLPFPSKDWPQPMVSDKWQMLSKAIHVAPERGKDVVLIDDFQYLLANEFMNRASEKGFEKFTEIAHHAWSVVKAAMDAPGDHRVYFLSHIATDDSGHSKAKTIGKMLDEKITLEGMFTVVLKSIVDQGEYFFSTENSGFDTVKSPMGLFKDRLIENDLAAVDAAIVEYYGIKPIKAESK